MAPAAGRMGTRRALPVRPRSAWRLPPRSVMRRTAGPRAAVLEYAFNPWLSFKTEYLYLNLGTDGIANGAIAGVPSRCLRRRPSIPSRSASTSSLVGGSPRWVAELLRAFDCDATAADISLRTAITRVDSSGPQTPNRGSSIGSAIALARLPWSTCCRRTLRKTEPQKGRSRKL